MQLRFQDLSSFYAFNKPYGMRTHEVNDDQTGFVETLSEKLNKKLFVVHRLDKETSGTILFAKDKKSAQELVELFEKHQIQKTYLFLTDQKIIETEFTVTSKIERQKNQYVSLKDGPSNSETHFKLIKHFPEKNFFLWQAQPKTGKPHQIRLHAQDAGIPILGDKEHGGSDFFRMALHAWKVEFLENKIESKIPPLFINPELDPLTLLLLENWFKRHEIYEIPKNETYRLIHHESNEFRADIYGDHLWVYDYTEAGFTETQKLNLQNFADSKNLKPIIRHMLNRGQGVGGKEKSTLSAEAENHWIAEENSVKYLLKTDAGFSPGLFLDQRENRLWVKNNSEDKKVLNLFCYTAGFSVNAALGKAKQVTSVDVSQNFLEWAKEIFNLNKINLENHEFFAQDTLLFLKGALKRHRTWDLIICDPPSFGRSRDGVWRLEKDLPALAEFLLKCLSADGEILFTSNYEGWNLEELKNQFSKKLKKNSYQFERLPYLSLDLELTDSRTNLMKGFVAKKRI